MRQLKIEQIKDNFDEDTTLAFEYDGNKVPDPLLQLREFSIDEIKILIRKSNYKFYELDPMPTSLVKTCIDELSRVSTQIINLSLTNTKMPTKFKIAIVKPRLKKNLFG